jgi:cell division protein FtsB
MPEPRRSLTADRARFTGRAGVLAVVICAIALSLAYPVREYIAQRRQIDQLQAERTSMLTQLRSLQQQQQRFNDPSYLEQFARDKLHFCMPGETCYVIIGSGSGHGGARAVPGGDIPWYERLWQSVQQADRSGPGGSGERGGTTRPAGSPRPGGTTGHGGPSRAGGSR